MAAIKQSIEELVRNDSSATNHSQLSTLLAPYNFERILRPIARTIFIYDIYEEPSSDELSSLHTFALLLTDQSLPLEVERKGPYQIDSEAAKHIRRTQFKLNGVKEDQENAWIYDNEAAQVRVVALPFPESLADTQKIQKAYQDIQKEAQDRINQTREAKLQGDKLRTQRQKIQSDKKDKFKELMQKQKQRWLRIFQIQCVINCCLQKTDAISLCGVAELKRGRLKKISQYQEEIQRLFDLPKEAQPQLIVHSCPQDKEDKEESNPAISTVIFQINGGIRYRRKDWLQKKYFWKHQLNFKTKFLSSNNKNRGVHEITNSFITSWRESALASLTCFGTTTAQILKTLNANTQTEPHYTISQIDEAFNFSSLDLPTDVEISPFYSRDRLRLIFKDQEIDEKHFIIPKSIKQIVFAFFLEIICRQFLDKYNEKEDKHRRNQTAMLAQWKIFLKRLYELCFTLSSPNDQLKNQSYFDFVCFIISSSERIKNILGQETGISSYLKSALKKASPRKDIAQKYIMENKNKFLTNEELNYYNLLLLMVQRCRNSQALKDRKYIELHLYELKAYNIAEKHIHDGRKIVEAIRSYAHICLEYPKLDPINRSLINFSQVEKRMARLLMIVDLSKISADIYFKNQMLNQANKACKEARKSYQGNERSEKLMEWASRFEKQLQYELAMDYYRDAYDCAKTLEVSQKVIRRKLQCNSRKKKAEPQETLLPFEKFVSPQTKSKDEFTSQTSLASTYRKIRKTLEWDSELECGVMGWEEVEEEGDNGLLGGSTYEIE